MKEKVSDLIIDEIVNEKVFEKSETEIQTFEPIEELKYPQGYDSKFQIVILLDDLNEKQIIHSWV